jgi:hypothetical protein
MKDLFILVADKNMEYALKGAVARPKALGIRPVEADIRPHAGRDGGARKTGPELLALQRRLYRHALLVFDFEGSGTDLPNNETLEAELDARLEVRWGKDAKSIVIAPELEVWIWGSDNAVENAIDWPAGQGIRKWLLEKGFKFDPNSKPCRPKEALEAALNITRQPRSSTLFQNIASHISLARCNDNAFVRLRSRLQEWFSQ